MGASLSKLIQDIMSLMSDVILLHAHPFTITQGAFKLFFACWFTNLSWYIAGTIAKFQNAQVAKSSPEISSQVSHMPAISPARAAINVATHAWTKLYDEIMSWISGVYECRQCHA